ncbi:MAG: phosphatidate cytidylyltransferase [Proteobacteria bacterium]|nr:phosphatidate cytidylyltransferase [Pseudomonadota bacterium]
MTFLSSNLSQRIASAAVLAPIAVAAIYAGGVWLTALIALAFILMVWEWQRMCGRSLKWLAAGVPYLVVPCVALVWLRLLPESGLWHIVWLLGIVWSADIGAYFTGRTVGGPKLAPQISPNKTISGAVGGLLAAIVFSLTLGHVLGASLTGMALWAVPLALASIAGDLLESGVKRHFNIKDSSHIIPGHGGVLDRLDSLLTTAPLLALLALLHLSPLL